MMPSLAERWTPNHDDYRSLRGGLGDRLAPEVQAHGHDGYEEHDDDQRKPVTPAVALP